MAENTKIEWAQHTFNPWIGCQKVGPGCDHCYAEVANGGAHAAKWGPHAERVRTRPRNWALPAKWNAAARAAGERHRVFCSSLADVFDTHASVLPEWRADLAELIQATPDLDWLLLTKRIGNADQVLREMFPDGTPANIWVGITVTGQAEADRDIVKLLKLKADHALSVAYLSMEPLLGAVDLTRVRFAGIRHATGAHYHDVLRGGHWSPGVGCSPSGPNDHQAVFTGASYLGKLDWVIVGGETGAEARPMHIGWVRALRDQCAAAGTAFLFKQWGNWFPFGEIDAHGCENSRSRGEEGGLWHEWPDGGGFSVRMDKRDAGRLLDRRTWDDVPADLEEA
ncbi:hypothetical protein OCH239_09300 [Roseivivax halodurans JCM 10272]|uniref:Gp37Gp68 family protein n=1 Tax=Roseivivax halodurans JCM 10272 TaxID=1449350 RepID=X7EC03_9RHOB|nr:phage Gp37/Gp68 family protein [Roseivivax halodurans]ETX13629.1 hypothetical protein OCH239_09300 [Roseivivax halodurans JCM 10272]